MKQAKWWLLAALATGVGVIAVSAVFIALHLPTVQPLQGAYGDQAMLAFELADTPETLTQVIGTDPPSAATVLVRRALDRANYLDFLYIALYAPFIACSCAGLALRRRLRWLWLGVLLAPLAALFDVAENLALLGLTRDGADRATLLAALHFRTFAKWELLAATSALFAAGFIGGPRRAVSALAGAVALAAVAAGILAAVNSASFLTLLVDAIVVVWVWQLGYAGAAVFGAIRR